MRTREAAVREAIKTDDDRGAVLFILLLFLVIFIAVATLALDLAAKGDRAQDLQNTADAAALAGVVQYQEHLVANPGDVAGAEAVAQAVIEQVMAQNGVPVGVDPDPDDESEILVTLNASENGTRLQVTITDTDPDQFLPTTLLGEAIKVGDPAITRSATAEFVACELDCPVSVSIQKPIGTVSALGQGDGYKPILVNNRLYAINHNSNNRQIVCIDRITRAACWNDGLVVSRDAYDPSVSFYSNNPEMPHTAVVGSRIYWSVSDQNNGHRLFCWETVTEGPCGSAITLDSSLLRFDNVDDTNGLTDFKDENRGGGTFTVLGERVFSFTDDHRIHCWDPAISFYCGDYGPDGNPTRLGNVGFPASSPVDGNHGSSIDRIVDENTGFVYSTLHIPFAQNVDCSSPLVPGLNLSGERVVVINKEGRYLASDFVDNVYATDDGATEAAWWDIESFEGDVSLQSVVHGEYLDAVPFIGTSIDLGDDDNWSLPITDNNDAYWLNSTVEGTVVDVDEVIEEGDEEPFGVPGAEWNFFEYECGIDPGRVDPGPDYFVDGTWLHCYDTGVVSNTPGPCPSFTVTGTAGAAAGTPSPIHADGTRVSGRLWFSYSSRTQDEIDDGVEASKVGVCSSGYSTWNHPADDDNLDPTSIEINCVDIANGNYSASKSSAMSGVLTVIQDNTTSDPGAWGDPHWNRSENRLFYPTERQDSRIVCYDFDDVTTCPGTPIANAGVETQDYGFVSDGNCVFALGHTSFFWAFKASDVTQACDATIPPAEVERCSCGDGTFSWGELDFGAIDLDLFDVFGVRVGTYHPDPDQSVPIFPADGSFISFKPAPEGGIPEDGFTVPLDTLDIPDGEMSVLIHFNVRGLDEELIPDVGEFQVRDPKRRPILVD